MIAEGETRRVGVAVRSLFAGAMGRGLSEAARAARGWYVANGDRERAHTTGVWLRPSSVSGADPVLFVALDSNLLAQELATNKDLYLSRLSFVGIAISDIRFGVGKAQPRRKERSRDEASRREPLPDLSPAEVDAVERACQALPEGVRQSASRAMCASLRRNKANTSPKP